MSDGMRTTPHGSLFDARNLEPWMCACDTAEDGWRPCPSSLCERPDHDHTTCPKIPRLIKGGA